MDGSTRILVPQQRDQRHHLSVRMTKNDRLTAPLLVLVAFGKISVEDTPDVSYRDGNRDNLSLENLVVEKKPG